MKLQLRGKRGDGIGTADHVRQRNRHVRSAARRPPGRAVFSSGSSRDRDRRDEAVAAAGNVRDVAIARLAIAQGAAERGNVDPEIAVLDERIGPDATHQLLIAQQLTSALNERCQDLAGAAAEVNGRVAIEKQLSRWKESEGPEGYLAHRIDRTSCLSINSNDPTGWARKVAPQACDMSMRRRRRTPPHLRVRARCCSFVTTGRPVT